METQSLCSFLQNYPWFGIGLEFILSNWKDLQLIMDKNWTRLFVCLKELEV
jgi:hypothetical protein